jgi:hypothetical protein
LTTFPKASSVASVIAIWKIASSASDASGRRRSSDSRTSGHCSSGRPARSKGSHESGAIEHYTRIIEVTDGVDLVTQDMVIDILHDEQGHLRLFEGFLREYEAEGLA